MPRDVVTSINEQAFILEALREGHRLDGRSFDAFREFEIKFGDDYGAVDVRLGKTHVAVRISAEVVTPFADRKFDGIFTITCELSPLTSSAFEAGRPTAYEALLSRTLEKTVRRSGALDTESLCIVAGSKCFAIRADIHVLVHDGNILDTACVALITALQHFRRPDVSVEGETVTVWKIREREPVKLSIMHQPLCVSFSYFDSGDIFLVDASAAEERIREGELVVSLNKFGEVCQIAKHGGITVDALSLLQWTKIAEQKVKVISSLIQQRLADDERERDVGGLIAELSAENAR